MARTVFKQLCADLEHEPERWTVRLCDPAGDVIWRNIRQREHYVPAGYVPSPTLRWEDCQVHFTPDGLDQIERVTREAFATGQPVKERVRFEMCGRIVMEECTYLAAFGCRSAGVLAIHVRPCDGASSDPESRA